MVRLKNMKIPKTEDDYGTFQLDAMGDLFFKYKIQFNGEPKLLPELLMDDSVYINNNGIQLDPNSILFKTAQKDLTDYFEEQNLKLR
ncbi:hypothetical protein [Marinilactibacillus psychrotolerans]|uniref:Uncharacterized protein n=1 Tax=Marinilactibacillus psychrotolerans TaxID=191770 RepID=A0A511H0E8_9LACT|nr:hypothetical protein [Marinilactibacillus psychrotolerans]TLQ06089.1 hypothetical protein FEZ48_11170 [Marinilactibacillus psychrotolerans]GEL67012.1 hypothetical protein MPS01_11670 [Marinilactibacillus psychrotolerans]GEQ36157.1 hypothetical protein M132T_16650 [Marinilactibacillus psychrotolerans]SDC76048.1 hypothetical protein SAMN04488013_10922 [Marinilactibacillus psychrotolerans]